MTDINDYLTDAEIAAELNMTETGVQELKDGLMEWRTEDIGKLLRLQLEKYRTGKYD